MQNKMSDLRNHLFATLEALSDKDQPMDIERAKAISEVAQVVINSAKTEIELIKAVGNLGETSDFFERKPVTEGSDRPRLVSGAGTADRMDAQRAQPARAGARAAAT